MTLYIALFIAGILTILLPCILPLIPIVLGVSIAGRSRLRPLLTVLGMLVSFVGFTLLLNIVLAQFVETADILRIATYQILLLFGIAFVVHRPAISLPLALLSGFFFFDKGWLAVAIAAAFGGIAMLVGGRVATRIQQFGTSVQTSARETIGTDAPLTAFIIGLTLGLVWVPCAGPALGFALTLVRDEPGLRAAAALTAYGMGTAIPLLLIGYGGQYAVHSVRALSRFTGIVKTVAGILLILSALAFQFGWATALQTLLVEHTSFGTLGTDLEEKLFGDDVRQLPLAEPEPLPTEGSSASADLSAPSSSSAASSTAPAVPSSTAPVPPKTSSVPPSPSVPMRFHSVDPVPSTLPKLSRAPELTSDGPWHNSPPLTLAALRGKVVLVDFWTYSCINCIRTLPYLRGYWDKYGPEDGQTLQDAPFVILGVHTPEFVFEKSEANVQDAIERHDLQYPVVQDNDYKIWRSFANRYWPAKYLIDAEGTIRYTHFGEGAYDETDERIAELLREIGVSVEGDVIGAGVGGGSVSGQSPETYLGARSWPALANGPAQPTDDSVTYAAPGSLALHKYALVGTWQLIDDERQTLRSDTGEIRMHFKAGEVNLVMGMEPGSAPSTAQVLIDGNAIKSFSIDRHDLFSLWKGDFGEHDLVLKITGPGAQGYAFTFGG